jgi:hypothetical protein
MFLFSVGFCGPGVCFYECGGGGGYWGGYGGGGV